MATRQKKRRKPRNKAGCIREYCRDIPEDLYDRILVSDVKKNSGVTLETCVSPQPGNKTLKIRGTRSQVLEAFRVIGEMTGLKESDLQKASFEWLDWVQDAFPNLEGRSYFLPPVYIRRVPTAKRRFAGQTVLMIKTEELVNSFEERVDANALPKHSPGAPDTLPTPSRGGPDTLNVQKSDVIDDEAFQKMFYNFQKMSEVSNEVFMCLSQFPFGSYLGEPCFAPAVAHLPSPSNLPFNYLRKWRQGDFDFLIIHKNYGFVICEVKAIGYTQNSNKPTEEQGEDVVKKFTEAVEQLDKAEAMLSHLASDIAMGVRITKTIACPNLSSSQIQENISNNQQLKEALCKCFHRESSADVGRLILCSDHMSNNEAPQSISEEKLKKLQEWWQERVALPGPDKMLMDRPDLYKQIIARFCGPASTVKVPSITEPRISIKTLDQAVSHVGDCYTAHMILFPEQIEVLSRAPPRLFIVGPPGTGKTTVLLLMATEWLRQGNNVYVLSTWERSLAVTFMLNRLLQEVLDKNLKNVTSCGQVRVLQKNFRSKKDIEDTINDLVMAAEGRSTYIIADEVGPDLETEHHAFAEFCGKSLKRFPKGQSELHLWAASCQDYVAPDGPNDGEAEGWEVTHFTRPLRSPPAVVREVQKAPEIRQRTVRNYIKRDAPDHGDGLPVKWIYHPRQRNGCRSPRVEDCLSCGRLVASFLLQDLRLKSTASKTNSDTGSDRNRPACLQYRDVFIMTWMELDEDAGILQSLRESEVPVRVMY